MDSDMIVMSANRRNNRVAQLVGTSDSGFTIIPLEGKHISIPVIQRSGKRDLTTVTNLGLGSRDVHNRSSVHIDRSLSASNTTIIVHQFNSEAIRIISVRFGEHIDAVFRNGDRSVVLKPSVSKSRGRHRVNVSIEHNIVGTLGADDRIRNQLDGRIRVHHDRSESEGLGLAAGSGLANLDRIDILCRLVIDRSRSVNKDVRRNILDNLTITIPGIDLTASNAANGRGRHLDRSAFANRVNTAQVVHSRNNRNSIHIHAESIVSNTVLRVEVHQMRDFHNVVGSTESRLKGLNLVGSTRKDVGVVHLILVPLVGQHRIIVVVKVSAQRDITAFADFAGVTRDVRVRSFIDIHVERIGNRGTTIAIGHLNGEDVRILVGGNPRLTIVVVETGRIRSVLTALIPSIGGIEVNAAINPSSEDDVLNARSIVTNIRVTINRDDRVAFHVNRVGGNRNDFTTRNVIDDVSLVGIVNRIAVIDVSLCTELSTVDGLQLHAIQLPHVGQVIVNVGFIDGIAVFVENRITVLINHLDRITILVKLH